MLTAIAIDDEGLALKVIQRFASQLTEQLRLEAVFTQTSEALAYLAHHPVDVVFLDIQMPNMTGLELSRLLPAGTQVIFTTAHPEYAMEGFNLQAADYLLKPFSITRFAQAVDKASALARTGAAVQPSERAINIRADYSLIKVPLRYILYIEGLSDYLKIFLEGRKPLVARHTMQAMMMELPPSEFVRIHRSYIVPIDRIESVRSKTVYLQGGTQLPIGATYEEPFMRIFQGGK